MSERREFEIEFIEDEAISVTHESGVPDGIIQVVELKPGEIILDKDQLRAAFKKTAEAHGGSSSQITWLERELFGEGE